MRENTFGGMQLIDAAVDADTQTLPRDFIG